MPPVLPILPIPHTTAEAPRSPVAVERLVAGQPTQATANAYSSPDQTFHCGIWEGDIGAWRVRYTEHELCHMLAGKVRMTSDDGHETVVAAGDSFVIPAGFTGIWEVLEPARKLYAVYEPTG
ncbi:MAG: cupin domain-containing protein [Lysobacteraceae bacterium]